MSDTDILRRIAERGLKLAENADPQFIDLFQHLLNEIQCLERQMEEERQRAHHFRPLPATVVLEGEVLPPETPIHRQARELLEELQAKEAASSGASGLRM